MEIQKLPYLNTQTLGKYLEVYTMNYGTFCLEMAKLHLYFLKPLVYLSIFLMLWFLLHD